MEIRCLFLSISLSLSLHLVPGRPDGQKASGSNCWFVLTPLGWIEDRAFVNVCEWVSVFIYLVSECISVIKRKWLKGVWSGCPIQMEEGQRPRMLAADHIRMVRKRASECNRHICLPVHTHNPGTTQWSLQAAIHGWRDTPFQPCNLPRLAAESTALSQGFLETSTLLPACHVYVQSNRS